MLLRHRMVVLSLVCVVFAVAGVASAARPYYLTDLGNLSAGDSTCDARAINTVGGQLQIVGMSQDATLTMHAWYWTQASGMVNLDTQFSTDLGATGAVPTGVNSSGKIVGTYSNPADGGGGFVYQIGGTATKMVLPGDPNGSDPTNWWISGVGNINDNGLACGTGGIGINPTPRPFLYNINTKTLTDISGLNTYAFAINNHGWVAGRAGAPSTVNVWNGNTWTDLGVPSTSYTKGSTPMAINNNGDVAGLVGYDSATQGHACYVQFNGSSWDSMVDLGNLSAYESAYVHSRAQGINDSRQVVGYAWTTLRTATTEYAFVAGTTAGSEIALNTLISTANQTNWRLSTAYAIDNSGNIVGGGLYNGVAEAYLLKPAMLGDANLDGTVDIADLSKVLTNYDKNGLTWADGDFDGSGTVDIQDLSKVLTNYDKSAAASAGVRAVPEPSSLALIAIGMIGLLAHRWRKRP